MLLYQILAYTIHGKIKYMPYKTIDLKYLPHGRKNLHCQMDHNQDEIFKITSSVS